ncbi:MAG: response regulator [Ignavibacteriales bacterium]|nr:response regulator [Ignavibacteriales bacterium]
MDATAPKRKVLIIDDDPSLRRLVQVLFERDGFDVSLASEGSEGVQLALMNPPHIIILDIMMEGLHGFEVCKMLRANSSMRRTAIIIISGKSYKPDIDKAMELGADAYVVKPFSPKELLQIAIEHMNKRASQL